MKATYYTHTPEETIELGERLSYYLKRGDSVLLFGDLGSGKTHFTKGIARGLGITDTIKSPTFAYVNKYTIGKQIGEQIGEQIDVLSNRLSNIITHLYHYDLYRLNPGADLTSLGYHETIEDRDMFMFGIGYEVRYYSFNR